jgi:hypothetical protein
MATIRFSTGVCIYYESARSYRIDADVIYLFNSDQKTVAVIPREADCVIDWANPYISNPVEAKTVESAIALLNNTAAIKHAPSSALARLKRILADFNAKRSAWKDSL